jgi:hypothetical protein
MSAQTAQSDFESILGGIGISIGSYAARIRQKNIASDIAAASRPYMALLSKMHRVLSGISEQEADKLALLITYQLIRESKGSPPLNEEEISDLIIFILL